MERRIWLVLSAVILAGCGGGAEEVEFGAVAGSAGTAGAFPEGGRVGMGGLAPTSEAGAGGQEPTSTLGGAAGAGAAGAAPGLDPQIKAATGRVEAAPIMADIGALSGFFTRNTCSSTVTEARDWIAAEFESIGGLEISLDPFTITDCGASVTRYNVVAVRLGTHPDRVIVLGGHYDSISSDGVTAEAPGANDSGSQTALVLAVARALADLELDATLIFAAFAGEEQGLVGSRSFSARYRDYVSPFAEVEAMINADMVGGDSTVNDAAALQRYRIFSAGTPREGKTSPDGTPDDTSPSRGLMRAIVARGRDYVPSMTAIPVLREDRPGRGSDQTAFLEEGIAAVRVMETVEETAHQHSDSDLPAYITPEYTARVGQVITAAVANLARAPLAPSWSSSGIDTTSTVSWTPDGAGPAVDHFVLAARRVDENEYSVRLRLAGEVRSHAVNPAALGVTDGDYYVSVAAVDAAGHESLFAYPEYRCDAGGCAIPPDALDVTAVD